MSLGNLSKNWYVGLLDDLYLFDDLLKHWFIVDNKASLRPYYLGRFSLFQ